MIDLVTATSAPEPSSAPLAPAAGWKTFLVNVAVGAALAALGYAQKQNWVQVVPPDHPEYALYIGGLISGLNIYLRSLTNTTIFKNTSPAPFPPPKG